nr:hypothetical protein [Tanacetum cinerariifolium]
LRIGRSNFRLPSDIQSKESTLQVVYDVLRNSPFFRAFLVTADVLKIYMQEFWATAKLHHNSIRFKMDTKKSVLDLEAFREMLHISPRILSQSFAELPFKKEIRNFLDVERTEAEQLKIILKRSRQETHISQQHGSSTDEGTGFRPGVLDVPSDDSEEELSWNSSDDEDDTESGKGGDEVSESEGESDEKETRQEEEESFDPIPRTPEGSEDKGSD